MVRTIGGVVLVWTLVVSPVFVTGCSPQVTTPAAPEEDAGESYVGPYPIGVAVSVGENTLTLESVEVSELETPWPAAASSLPVSSASTGSRYVRSTFVISGKPDPGPSGYLAEPQLIVDGKSVPIGGIGAQWDEEPPPGTWPSHSLSFQVPADARSVVLQVKPSFAATQTVGFRLW